MFEDKGYNDLLCCDDFCDEKHCCQKEYRCHKKVVVKIYVECGKECVCLYGILLGSYCKCDRKVLVIKEKCGKKSFINFDKISYWKVCDGWY
ncbi:hypothetical protein [Oceanirhabdus sp. W0125-5]|uniref:hypothetical protein n=1 Tax=Oceanirhabdus sp. W0125-5 TaxID=2999116 RepID=UPI0022F2A588|nr:hypothetical protein [Oceanirhabdus sp. W0125-5]WBW97078.1 hypothetical protein OW730_25820 [Oceanirhabdus sp. W0125-5]